MNKIKLFIIFTLLLTFFSGCSTIEKYNVEKKNRIAPPVQGENTVPVSLVSHIDGDTSEFRLLKSIGAKDNMDSAVIEAGSIVIVRFLGVNTPESRGEVEYLGKKASEFTKQQLEKSEIIELEIDEKAFMDKHKRLLGHIFVDGINLQIKILENGYGRVAYLFDNYKYIDDYYAAEDRARSARLNIFSIEDYVLEDSNGYNMDAIKPEDFARESLADIEDTLENSIEEELFDKAVDVLKENLFHIQLVATD